MSPSSELISGSRADRLRIRIAEQGVEITESEFREYAIPNWEEQLNAINERAGQDPGFRRAISAAVTLEVLKQCEDVARDAMRNAPDPNDRRQGAELLLNILAKKQNVEDQ